MEKLKYIRCSSRTILVARLEALTHEVSRQYSRSSLYLAESHFDNRIELARMLDTIEKSE